MYKPYNFQGKISFSPTEHAGKKTLMTYSAEPLEVPFDQTIMSSFDYLNFSIEEKKILSKKHRKILNHYRQINLFSLNTDAQKLIDLISKCKSSTLCIEACDYGAYICLAALFSGKLPSDKKIEFHFEGSPLALFPKNFLKNPPKNQNHKIVFKIQEDSWLSPFSTLYNNEKIKCHYLKVA